MGKKYEEIRADILKQITAIDTREGSFTSDMISPVSMEMEKVYTEMDRQKDIMFINTAAGEYIDRRGAEYGISRKPACTAHGICVFEGRAGQTIPKETRVTTDEGLRFFTIQDGIISDQGGGKGKIEIPVEAEAAGSDYNVLPNKINSMVDGNLEIRVYNPEKMMGGTRKETDEELTERILFRLQAPATSGNAYHYKMWAMEVDGVGDAKVFPLDRGAGTVTVLPITPDMQRPDEKTIQAVKEHIETMRPIGADVEVAAPAEFLIDINAGVMAKKKYMHKVKSDEIKKQYEALLKEYIMNQMLQSSQEQGQYRIDYYKCLSLFYEIEYVSRVLEFTLNGGTEHIYVLNKQLATLGTVEFGGGFGYE